MKKLSIVLPYYNPSDNWEMYICDAYTEIQTSLGFNPELIIVDDGSDIRDESALKFLQKEIPDFKAIGYNKNKGKGAALRYGVNIAEGEKIMYTDIDFPYTTESFLKIWQALEFNDVAIGIKDKNYYSHLPKERIWISKTLRKMIGVCFRIPITDTQCGLKGFNQNGKAVFLNTTIDRYLCDLEFVYKAYRTKPKLNIVGKEVSLRNEVEFGRMNKKILISEFANFIKILKS